ncbi:hypothetical protein U1Q18_035324 [Sarracenia purpurea var. burkii]
MGLTQVAEAAAKRNEGGGKGTQVTKAATKKKMVRRKQRRLTLLLRWLVDDGCCARTESAPMEAKRKAMLCKQKLDRRWTRKSRLRCMVRRWQKLEHSRSQPSGCIRRHLPRLKFSNGFRMEGATLVVVRPTTSCTETKAEE